MGKEIYGAGESLWMYLMFEALGKISDRELMLVNLDLIDIANTKSFPPQRLNFILFNPTDASRSTTITIPGAQQQSVRLRANGNSTGQTIQVPGRSFIRLEAEY